MRTLNSLTEVLIATALLPALYSCASHAAPAGETTLPATLMTGSTPEERAWVESLNQVTNQDPIERQGVAFGAVYYAGSGRTCRTVTSPGNQRLACTQQDGWYLVPDVFGSEDSTPVAVP